MGGSGWKWIGQHKRSGFIEDVWLYASVFSWFGKMGMGVTGL